MDIQNIVNSMGRKQGRTKLKLKKKKKKEERDSSRILGISEKTIQKKNMKGKGQGNVGDVDKWATSKDGCVLAWPGAL